MDIETVTIHRVIDGIPREVEVPASTVDSWVAQEWIEGPFPVGDTDRRPPKTGKGSSFQAWVDYAAQRDIVLEVGATREDIIAAVEQLDAQVIASRQSVGSETSPVGETPTAPEEDPNG